MNHADPIDANCSSVFIGEAILNGSTESAKPVAVVMFCG
jgi:hypothetical protein